MSSDAAGRRAYRAKHMVFAKASSLTEHEEHGVAFWQRATAASKFQAIVELVEAGWYLSGADAARSGLDRSTHGVAKLGS
jgi:hypothetical protein